MTPAHPTPMPNVVNARLKYQGRANLVMARHIARHRFSPWWLNHMLATCDRDIYQETVDAMGYDPLAKR